jgi:hypothetical protein
MTFSNKFSGNDDTDSPEPILAILAILAVLAILAIRIPSPRNPICSLQDAAIENRNPPHASDSLFWSGIR